LTQWFHPLFEIPLLIATFFVILHEKSRRL